MKAIEFPGCNRKVAEKQDEYNTLPAFVAPNDPDGRIICCYELDEKELKVIQKTGKVYLMLMTFNHPLQPINMTINLEDWLEIKQSNVVEDDKVQSDTQSSKEG